MVPRSMFGNSLSTKANAPRHGPAKGARANSRITFEAQRKLDREKTLWHVVEQEGKRWGRARRKTMPEERKRRDVVNASGTGG